jgi:hypothetical protein
MEDFFAAVDTKPIDKFLQDIGRISNPDEFSEAEALHPLQRGKKVFFYHASTSPIAPHLMIHPDVQQAIDVLSDAGIIKPEELEAAKNPETLLKMISERVKDGPVREKHGSNLDRVSSFLSGETQQDAAAVFHAGTLSSARERAGAYDSGRQIFLHAYQVDTTMVDPVIHDDIEIGGIGFGGSKQSKFRQRLNTSLQRGDRNISGRKPIEALGEVESTITDTIATGKKVGLSGQVHPYRNAVEDAGNVSVSIPRTAVGSSVRYSGATDMTPVLTADVFDEFVRKPILAARAALGTLGAKVSSASDEIAESAGPVQRVARRIGVMSRGTLAKVIEAGETAARVMR